MARRRPPDQHGRADQGIHWPGRIVIPKGIIGTPRDTPLGETEGQRGMFKKFIQQGMKGSGRPEVDRTPGVEDLGARRTDPGMGVEECSQDGGRIIFHPGVGVEKKEITPLAVPGAQVAPCTESGIDRI